MADKTTKLTVQAQAKGFEQAQKAVTNLQKSSAKVLEDQVAKGKKATKAQDELTLAVLKQVKAVDSLVSALTPMAKAYTNANKEAQKLDKTLEKSEKRQKEASRRAQGKGFFGSRGFTQGLLQGAAPNTFGYLQRGPGMRRQAAGQFAGSMARRTFGGARESIAGGLSSGASGFISGLSNIPFVGLAAGPLQAGVSAARGAIALRGAEADASPFLNSARRLNNGRQVTDTTGKRQLRREVGYRFGMSDQQALGPLLQIAQMGGGVGNEIDERFLSTAFGAQRGFGVSAGASGAFLAGQRQNAVTGTNNAAETLEKIIADGLAAGLEGSELTRSVDASAQAILSFAQTGIRYNPEGLTQLRAAFRISGEGAVRSDALGRQALAGIQNLGVQGPRTSGQFLAFRKLGKFSGGGLDGFQKARKALETGEGINSGAFRSLLLDVAQASGGDTAAGELGIESFLRELGVNVTATGAEGIRNALFGRGDSEISSIINAQTANTRRVLSDGGVARFAEREMTPGLLKSQAGVQNEQLSSGRSLAATVIKFDKSVASLQNEVVDIMLPVLQKASSGAVELSNGIKELVELIRQDGLGGLLKNVGKGVGQAAKETFWGGGD